MEEQWSSEHGPSGFAVGDLLPHGFEDKSEFSSSELWPKLRSEEIGDVSEFPSPDRENLVEFPPGVPVEAIVSLESRLTRAIPPFPDWAKVTPELACDAEFVKVSDTVVIGSVSVVNV